MSYPEVGATATQLPDGYQHLVTDRVVGRGDEAFRQAAGKLLRWDVHREAGVAVRATTPVAEPGSRVVLRWGTRLVGLSAPCEVVDVVDEPRRRGFAYGTLEGHPVQGEERFVVQLHEDGTVRMSVTAFSRPAVWWSRAAGPIVRRAQQRIARRYLRAL
ncbi:DUF1990 domain-containing protein [Georgenia sp. 10Sc9-8]|uniref:DUF1990 domain-containing protein n=1 Tax=Georgenia halotolerans TaxID=3028317 RepID=A0ABT5U397_9MICO|nr:DUF1990 domain-containing protein [Georgenia halotolerans]